MITVSLEIYSTTKFPQPINFPYCHKTLRTITIASYIIPHKAFQKRTFLSDNTNRYLNLHPLPQPHKTIRSTFQRNLTPQFDFSDRVHTHTHIPLLWRTKLTVQSLPWPAQNPSKPIHRGRCSLTLPPRGNRP